VPFPARPRPRSAGVSSLSAAKIVEACRGPLIGVATGLNLNSLGLEVDLVLHARAFQKQYPRATFKQAYHHFHLDSLDRVHRGGTNCVGLGRHLISQLPDNLPARACLYFGSFGTNLGSQHLGVAIRFQEEGRQGVVLLDTLEGAEPIVVFEGKSETRVGPRPGELFEYELEGQKLYRFVWRDNVLVENGHYDLRDISNPDEVLSRTDLALRAMLYGSGIVRMDAEGRERVLLKVISTQGWIAVERDGISTGTVSMADRPGVRSLIESVAPDLEMNPEQLVDEIGVLTENRPVIRQQARFASEMAERLEWPLFPGTRPRSRRIQVV
jgi:hypothetical protein